MTSTEIKTIELIVNSEQARKRLDELKAKLDQLKAKRQEALERGDSSALSLYSKEIKKVEKEIERTETKAQSMGRALMNLDKSSPNQLKQTLRELQKELNSEKVQRGSAEWDTLTKAIRETKGALDEVNNELRTTQQSSWSDRLAEWGNKWLGLVMNVQAFFGTAIGLRDLIQQALSDYANIEEAKAQVRKYTGLAAEDVDALNESLKAMDTRTPREQLNALAGDAGKLGITSKEGILDFVEAADMINVALGDDLGDGAVKNVGKLAMLFEEDKRMGLKESMLATASVINELSQNSSAGAGYLEEFTARVAGVGKQAGLTQAQIMGYAAVLDESMQEDATAATAFSQLLTKMYQEPAKFAALAGKDVQEFSRLLKEDANGALLAFLGSMKAQGGFEKLAPMFEKMGLDGTRATSVLSSVADKLGNVEHMQRLANQAYNEAVSIQNEFTVQNSTVQAGLDKAKKSLQDMRAELGEKLMPVAAKMLSFTTWLLKTLLLLVTWVHKNAKAIITVTAAIVVYNATIKAAVAWEALHNIHLRMKMLRLLAIIRATQLYKAAAYACAVVQGLLTVAFTLFTKGLVAARIQMNLLTLAMAKNPVGLIAVALSTAIALLLEFTNLLGLNSDEVLKQTKALRGKEKALKDINEAQKEANDSTVQEIDRIQQLYKVAQDENAAKKERLQAIQELNRIAPKWQGNLDKEGKLHEGNKKAIDEYIASLKKKALAEAIYEKLVGSMKEKADAEMASAEWDKQVEKDKKRYGDGGSFIFKVTPSELIRDMYLQDVQAAEDAIKQIEDFAKEKGIGEMVENLRRGNEVNGTPNSGSSQYYENGGKSGKPGNSPEEQLEKEKLARQLNEQIRYTEGETHYIEYQQALLDIDEEMTRRKRDLYKKKTNEWNKHQKELLDIRQKRRAQEEQWSLADIQSEEQRASMEAQRQFADGLLTEEQYEKRLDEIKILHMKKRANSYADFNNPEKQKEWEIKVEEEGNRQKMEARKNYLAKAKALQEEFFNKSIEEREQEELRLLDELIAAGVISEEKKQAYIEEIKKKYDKLRKEEKEEKDKKEAKKIENPLGSATGISSDFIDIFKKLDSLRARLRDGEAQWQDYAAVAVSALAFVSTAIGTVSQFFTEQQQAEENAITQRYDKEIQKVGENSNKGKKLEEQKQKELAKVKNKYRKKQMAMEISQAVASTAMAAINAYASAAKVSFLLAPIAAAMALAAGGVQIATIKKQHETESSGYYAGGFTGGNNYRKQAGIVHQGEFVANHEAVNNPNVLPFLRLIDHAQRNNTVASLTAGDVSRAISAPMATASHTAATAGNTSVKIIDTTSAETRDAIRKLNEKLEEGIHASVSITGEDGFERQWERYNKMKANR